MILIADFLDSHLDRQRFQPYIRFDPVRLPTQSSQHSRRSSTQLPSTPNHLTRRSMFAFPSPTRLRKITPTSNKSSKREILASNSALVLGNQNLRLRLHILESNRHAAEAHCTISTLENGELQEQLAEIKATCNRKGRQPKSKLGTWLTHPESLQERATDAATRKAKESAALEKQREKESAEWERRELRIRNTTAKVFEGTLASQKNKNKDDLKDLAAALRLDESGTKVVLFERIATYVGEHPELAEDERFSALFGRRRPPQAQPTAPSNTSHPTAPENLPPAPQIAAANPRLGISSWARIMPPPNSPWTPNPAQLFPPLPLPLPPLPTIPLEPHHNFTHPSDSHIRMLTWDLPPPPHPPFMPPHPTNYHPTYHYSHSSTSIRAVHG